MTAPRCSRCGRERTERKDSPGNYAGVNGWCSACTSRWYRAGSPEGLPPPMSHAARTALANAARTAAGARKSAEYARLRGIGCSPAQAALRLAMAARTGRQYERAYRGMAARGEAA